MSQNHRCRLCMGVKPNLSSIFRRNLSMKVMKLAEVKIREDDGLPTIICLDCEVEVEKCCGFIAQVKWAEKKFREETSVSQAFVDEYNVKEEHSLFEEFMVEDNFNSDEIHKKTDDALEETNENESFIEPFDVVNIPGKTNQCDDGQIADPLGHEEPLIESQLKTDNEPDCDPLGQEELLIETQLKSDNEPACDPLGQEEPLIETQLKTDNEPACDTLICMKEESMAMDIESSIVEALEKSTPSSSICMKKDAVAMDIESNTAEALEKSTPSSSVKGIPPTSTFSIWPAISTTSNNKSEMGMLQQMQTNFFVVSQMLPQNIIVASNPGQNLVSNFPTYSLGNSTNLIQKQDNHKTNQTVTSLYSCSFLPTILNTDISTTNFGQFSSANNAYLVSIGSSLQTNKAFKPDIEVQLSKSTNESKDQKNMSQTGLKDACQVSGSDTISEGDNNISKNVTGFTGTAPSTAFLPVKLISPFCSVCSVDFGDLERLNEHKDGRGFFCRVCTIRFESHAELESHFVTHSPYKCNICKKIFYCKKDCFEHRKSSDICNVTMECEVCKKTFYSKRRFKEHKIKMHLIGNVFFRDRCIVCSKTFKMSEQLRHHLRSVHVVSELVECKFCQRHFLGPDKLKIHVKSTHLDDSTYGNPFICQTCGNVFKNNKLLQAHKITHDDTIRLCEICGRSIKGKLAMASHIRYEHCKTGCFKCEQCNKQFTTEKKLQKHLRNSSQHNNSRNTPVYCEICGKTYKSSTILKSHLLTHSDEKPFKCEICGAVFKQRVTLRTHSRVHSSIGKYSCNDCGKSFRWKQTFDKHIKKCASSTTEEKFDVACKEMTS